MSRGDLLKWTYFIADQAAGVVVKAICEELIREGWI